MAKKDFKEEIKKNFKKDHKKKHHHDYEEDFEEEYEEEYEDKYKKDHKKDYGEEEEEAEYEKDYNYDRQTHVHEFLGSVMLAGKDPHTHRFAGVSGEAIPYGRSHIHKIRARTDFYEDHYHEIRGKSGPAIPVGEGRHVHFAEGETTFDDGHDHKFIVASLIEDPTGH